MGREYWCGFCSLRTPIYFGKEEDPMDVYKYFNPTTDPLMVGVGDDLMKMLDFARSRSGIGYTITCGLRSPDKNASLKGAVCDSAHLPDASGVCHAVDLECQDDHALFCLVFGLMMAGFRRIGIYVTHCESDPNKFIPRHIHVDDDPTKPLEVCWILQEQN